MIRVRLESREYQLAASGQPLRLPAIGVHLGFNTAGTYTIDPDPLLGHLGRGCHDLGRPHPGARLDGRARTVTRGRGAHHRR